jgi:4-amino-4-deoxy-L-arabinose transferase-like glycosyltransferase
MLLVPVAVLPEKLQWPAVVGLQSCLVGVICWLLFDLAERLFGVGTAQASVLVLLFYPWLYVHARTPMSIVAQMLCVMLLMNLLARELLREERDRVSESWPQWAGRAARLGLAMGIALLCHGTFQLSLLLIGPGVAGLAMLRRTPGLLGRLLLAAIIAGVIVAPWTYRNWRVSGRLIPVVTNSGYAYFWGNAHWNLAGKVLGIDERQRRLALAGLQGTERELVHFHGIRDSRVDAEVNRRMVEDIQAHPEQFVEKLALNSIEFYFPVAHDILTHRRSAFGHLLISRVVQSLVHLVLWGLVLWAIWRERQPVLRRRMLGLLACIAALVVPYLPFLVCAGHTPYVMSTVPLLGVLLCEGLASGPAGAAASVAAEVTEQEELVLA